MKLNEFEIQTRKYDMSQAEYAQGYYWRLAEPGILQLNNFTLGLTGEAGEVADILKKHLRDGNSLDRMHLIEECGDVLFYVARILDTIGSTLEEAMLKNQAKLEVRYPNGFTEEAGMNRDTVAERNAMEGINEDSKTSP